MRQTLAGLRWAAMVLAGCMVVSACQAGEDRATTDTGVGGATGSTGTAGGGASEAQLMGTLMAVHSSEVAMGRLGREKATNAQVRQFAQRIEREHRQFVEQHQQGGAQGGGAQGDTSQADPQLRQQAAQTLQRLQQMERGRAFDTAFVNSQVMAHEQALQRLDQMGGQGGMSGGMGAGQRDTAGGQTGGQTAGRQTGGQAGGQGATGGGQGTAAGGQAGGNYVTASRQLIEAHLEAARQLQQQLGGSGGNR